MSILPSPAASPVAPPQRRSRLTRWRRAGTLTALRWVLRRRYRVRIHGATEPIAGPALVLPNHPAYVDPAILLSFLPGVAAHGLRPLVYETTFRNRWLRPVIVASEALEVRELRRHRRSGRDHLRQQLEEVVGGLRRGERFLLYPSGRLQRDDREWLGPARATHDVLQQAPDATQIILVRVRGIWGSSFSCAAKGEPPELNPALRRSLLRLIRAGIFWVPKRDVDLFIEVFAIGSLRHKSRPELNAWLEQWYNVDGGESPVIVP